MRIRLQKGKQKELILTAKRNLTWKKLGEITNIPHKYLCNDLKNGRIYLPEIIYKKLCKVSQKNFDQFIIQKLHDNWGKSKGGINSKGSTIQLPKINFNEKLAELAGAILGDGNITWYKKGKKVGVYQIRIAGDLEKDKDYHTVYLRKLCKETLNLNARELKRENERFLDIYSKELVKLFISMGLKPGNKIKNQITIPEWIFQKTSYLKACIRGLIDTDGSIFRMSKRDHKLLRINFTNHNITLLKDTRKAFISLGFNPSKIINNRQFLLSRQSEIKKYLKEIGFSNKKHINRLKSLTVP
jgi:intein/homing endonuclease